MDKIFIVICEERNIDETNINVYPHETKDGAIECMQKQIDKITECNTNFTDEEIKYALKNKTENYFFVKAFWKDYYFLINIEEKKVEK